MRLKGGHGAYYTRFISRFNFQIESAHLKHVRTKTHKAFQEDRVKIHFLCLNLDCIFVLFYLTMTVLESIHIILDLRKYIF